MPKSKVGFEFNVDEIMKQVQQEAVNTLNQETYDLECPQCNKQISIRPGNARCPYCGTPIDFKLNIEFKG